MTTTQRTQRDRPETYRPESDRTDVRGAAPGNAKRAALAVIGIALVATGLRRRSRWGIALVVAGGVFLSSALGSNANIKRALASLPATSGQREDRWTASTETDVSRSVTVGKSPDELYEFWRDPDHLSRIMGHVADVTPVDSHRLRWTVDGPRGREFSWETRFVTEEPGERLRWKSSADATLPNEGTVSFRPASGDRGTIVTLSVAVDPPGGSLGVAALQRLDIVPSSLVGVALDRFKSLAETGEIPTLEKNASARGQGDPL